MDWIKELKKEIETKTMLDVGPKDWKVLCDFINNLLQKQCEFSANKIKDMNFTLAEIVRVSKLL